MVGNTNLFVITKIWWERIFLHIEILASRQDASFYLKNPGYQTGEQAGRGVYFSYFEYHLCQRAQLFRKRQMADRCGFCGWYRDALHD